MVLFGVAVAGLVLAAPASSKTKPEKTASSEAQKAGPAPVAEDQVQADLPAFEAALEADFRKEFDTPHFHVVTDASGITNAAEELGNSLEGAYYSINEVLNLPTSPSFRKVRAYFYRNERRFDGGGSRGIYSYSGLIAFYQRGLNVQELLGVMTHEASHAFLHQFVERPGTRLPLWLDEGFASYMENSSLSDGQLHPGVFYATERQLFHGGSKVTTPDATVRARWLAHEIVTFRFPGVERVLWADRNEFYDRADGTYYYATAWAVVHYLRHGVPDGPVKFSKLVQTIGAGTNSVIALQTAYGLTPAALQAALVPYVRGTLAHPPDAPPELLQRPRR